MSFWDFFKFDQGDATKNHYNRLHERLEAHLPPESSEKDQAIMACLAGLLARVAYIDLKIECAEKSAMANILKKFTDFNQKTIQIAVETASDEMTDLAGIENHLYCTPLNDLLTQEERYHVLESLFAFAASDGVACAQESEEIRIIAKSLQLTHQHFLAARATVIENLANLKNNSD